MVRADELEAEVVREQAIEAERDTWPIGPHMEPGDALDLDWLTDPALKALISDRRTRGIPAAGLPATGEPATPKPKNNPLGHALTQWIGRKQT